MRRAIADEFVAPERKARAADVELAVTSPVRHTDAQRRRRAMAFARQRPAYFRVRKRAFFSLTWLRSAEN
jgi:hypothetical protein